MTREELTNKFLSSESQSYILQLPTSYGKSYLALQKIDTWFNKYTKILIVIPRNVLKENWIDEIKKWKYDRFIPNITFTTYISFYKYCDASSYWDVVIFDEAHHMSERCMEAADTLRVNHVIALSATLKREHIYFFKCKYNTEKIWVKIKDAIDSDVLPDPKILLIAMQLDNNTYSCAIEKRIKSNTPPSSIKTVKFHERWQYKDYKGPLRIICTPLQYYLDLSNLVEWYKKKGMYNEAMKNLWLHKAGDRLKWLAQQKESIIKFILKELKNYRTLVFCQSIEQSEKLGCPCVNSNVGTENLERFNAKKIKHIASIDMLNEGLNPIDCKVGLFQMINSSQRISLQRIGRILRHKNPILIFPYWVGTREEEIINKLVQDYNPELIVKVKAESIKDNLK